MDDSPELWLCLSGGNALGAYHAGVYSALHQAGQYPSRIAGTSVGAIVGALIAGNRQEDRLSRLAEFWNIAADKFAIANVARQWDGSKVATAVGTLLQGRPGLFEPSFGHWWRRLVGLSSPSLFERSGLRDKLEHLIDFDQLNSGEIRLIVNAVDVTTGAEVVFDSAEMTITADHLMASSAFPILYSPERVGDRHMVDGGLAGNLPILPLFRDPPAREVRCLAFDLVTASGRVPESLDDAIHRAQDIVLSNQAKKSIELLSHRAAQWPTPASLLHVAYSGGDEVGGKMLEFSSASMETRRAAGVADAGLALRWLSTTADDTGDFAPHMSYRLGAWPRNPSQSPQRTARA